jgi:DNA transformation protein
LSLFADRFETARDLFATAGQITLRERMGRLCLHYEGTIFAIMMGDGVLFLKGASPFTTELSEADRAQRPFNG